MSQSSSIATVAEWFSPVTGIIVEFYRGPVRHTYHNPSASSMCRLAELVASNSAAFKVIPWRTGGIVGWYADVQRQPQLEEVTL